MLSETGHRSYAGEFRLHWMQEPSWRSKAQLINGCRNRAGVLTTGDRIKQERCGWALLWSARRFRFQVGLAIEQRERRLHSKKTKREVTLPIIKRLAVLNLFLIYTDIN